MKKKCKIVTEKNIEPPKGSGMTKTLWKKFSYSQKVYFNAYFKMFMNELKILNEIQNKTIAFNLALLASELVR